MVFLSPIIEFLPSVSHSHLVTHLVYRLSSNQTKWRKALPVNLGFNVPLEFFNLQTSGWDKTGTYRVFRKNCVFSQFTATPPSPTSLQMTFKAGHFCTTNSSRVLARQRWQTFENSWKKTPYLMNTLYNHTSSLEKRHSKPAPTIGLGHSFAYILT